MADRPHKAIALLSGGLDSMLAVRVIQEQGIEVEGINFYTGFCVEGHTHAIRNEHREKTKRNNALWSAEQLGIKLHIVDVIEEYKDVLLNPRHGYGSHMNPCLDCKVFMVRKAVEWIRENYHNHFDFIITGEVIGQRPKSQLKKSMPVVARESGAEDILLRPLCAKNLAPTKPEREGWINRDQLYGFSGRNRTPQMKLAASFGFTDYAAPAGGCCFLTDASYSGKLVDLWQARQSRDYELDDIMLLKVGRHLRPEKTFKVIVARDQGECKFMEGYRNQYVSLTPVSHKGPMALIDGDISSAQLDLAASIVARFGQGKLADEVMLEVRKPDNHREMVKIRPMPAAQIPQSWYL
ncbi:tRNA (5-methylaminomethyl-2-thiouridylate)-methyltransferase [Methylophaga frappieri]|uniref:tRNA (5-methylaminomethyl-2-thiouridylate)-methyltransferase n=1 Tax=Methylophaga frappieri (strain ATCC BAA-2434 / DSM 25690 / JAM7) TaxID=754477 RepID=I1YFR6_METFJ|nr:tRNA (5-methylaminomethyl-2-thiouridylate)-methyltransferase [Methylophaga frappieri]AFJ01759.1 tRNA (5-methylaminomethyl-2-thiouridylate)-methyltransferase [Methylophaga frappieri]